MRSWDGAERVAAPSGPCSRYANGEEVTHLNARSLLLSALVLTACQASCASAAFDYDANLGIAVARANRNCLDIGNGDLTDGQRILIVTSGKPQTVAEVEIARKVEKPCTAMDETKPGLHHYEFVVRSGVLERAEPAFAIANFGGSLTAGKSGVTGDLDGDGKSESFRACASSEGVHLTVWTGKPLSGVRRWHGYHYLGYDVTPNCTRKDTRPDAN